MNECVVDGHCVVRRWLLWRCVQRQDSASQSLTLHERSFLFFGRLSVPVRLLRVLPNEIRMGRRRSRSSGSSAIGLRSLLADTSHSDFAQDTDDEEFQWQRTRRGGDTSGWGQ